MRMIRRAVAIALWSTSTRALRVAAFIAPSNKTVITGQRKMSSSIEFHHLPSVDSTQDEAKWRIPKLSNNVKLLAIVTDEQTKGRGTSGRVWMSLSGNLFLTLSVPMERVPITMTLLPLHIGTMVAERVKKLVPSSKQVHVKWPNDVLLDDKKVAGVLIESQLVDGTVWLLIGIGVNLQRAPLVPQEGKDRGRLATSVQEHMSDVVLSSSTNVVLAQDLANSFEEWLLNPTTTSKQTLENWKAWANWKVPLKLRETGEDIMPIGVQSDGQLIVRGDNGEERNLIADYLF